MCGFFNLNIMELIDFCKRFPLYNDVNTCGLLVYLLHKSKGGVIETTLRKLSEETKLSVQNVRTSLSKLSSLTVVQQTANKHLTKITICKSICYVDLKTSTNKQLTNHQQTESVEIKPKKKRTIVKVDMVKTIDERKDTFYNNVMQNDVECGGKYEKKMLESFFLYWSEINKSGTKMKFEMQKTWELSGRLARWNMNNYDIKDNGYGRNYRSNEELDRQKRAEGYSDLIRQIRKAGGRG